jgi:hypothetical protein
MSREKAFISTLMVLILIVLSGASVWAAPGGQEPTEEPMEEPPVITGVVEEIEIVTEVDEGTGDTTTTVLVTLVDDLGDIQTVPLSPETAAGLELVQTDENGEPVLDENDNPIPNNDMVGETVEIPGDVIEDDEEDGEEEDDEENGEEDGEEEGEEPSTVHPVASVLAEFFAEYLPEFFTETLELDSDTIMGYHEEDGMGFGVIAQACWMASVLYDRQAEKNITPGDILNAKKEHDFDSITLSEDEEPIITLPNGETPKNWGQFRKAVLGSEKAKKNLGAIMSRREKQNETDGDDLGAAAGQGQGKGKKSKGPGEDGPPGKSKGGKKGGGPPAIPPGQEKDKGGGKGKGQE